jgi:hypothetical protein
MDPEDCPHPATVPAPDGDGTACDACGHVWPRLDPPDPDPPLPRRLGPNRRAALDQASREAIEAARARIRDAKERAPDLDTGEPQ